MKFKVILIIPILFIAYYSFTSCENNSEEHLYGNDCDTLHLTYAKIMHIFKDNCYACHTEAYNNHDIKTDSYTNLKAAVNTGKLWPAITHTGPYLMPKDQPQLSDCQIAMIGAWIHAGMPE